MDETHGGSAFLHEYWRVLKRRRWAAYSVLALAVLLAAVGSYMSTPMYRATAVVQIERFNPNVVDFKDVVSVDYSFAAYQDFYQTQYNILGTRDVARRTAEAIDLPNRPLELREKPGVLARLRGWVYRLLSPRPAEPGSEAPEPDPLDPFADFVLADLTIDPVRNSHLVNISFDGPDPVLAAEVANAHAQAFIAHNLDAKFDTARAASEFLDDQIVGLREEIARLDAGLQEYGLEEDTVSLADQQQMVLASMADVSERHTGAQLRRATAEARVSALESADPDSLAEVRESLLVRDLKSRYADLDRQTAQMAERFGEQWPELVSVRAEMERLRSRLVTETDEIFHRVLRSAEAELHEAQEQEQFMVDLLDRKKAEVQQLNRQSVDYASLRAEVDKKRSLLDQLLERSSETLVSTQMTDARTGNIRIVQRAEPPMAPFSPNVPRSVLLGLVLGAFGGVALAFLLEKVDNSIRTPEEIAALLDLPTLASITSLGASRGAGLEAAGGNPDLVAWQVPRASQSEAYRDLRTALMLSGPSGAPKTVVVTSCHPQEGKSVTAVNLAVVLSQLGRKVLLIDADLRRPRLHRALDIDNGSGLSTLLTGHATLDEVVAPTPVDGLTLLTAGPLPPNPSELLESEAFAALLRELARSDYESVVVDSPPLLSVTDPQILGRQADATVLVLKFGVTSRESARKAVERLRSAKAHLVGTVLNEVSAAESRYDYRYYEGGREGEERGGSDARARSGGILGERRRLRRSGRHRAS